MNKLKKLFGEIDMTWKKVIIFALITGAYTGFINLIPFLRDTSFQDIAITTEWWVLFAIVIAVNCKKPVEAGLKIFTFFLISQPLVYLIEMPFEGLGIWSYYKYWAIITILTLPGGMIANLVRKKNILGTLILTVALGIVATSAAEYSFKAFISFPRHVLTVVFCVAMIVFLIIHLVPKKIYRGIAAALVVITFAGTSFMDINVKNTIEVPLPEGQNWTCEFQENDRAEVSNTDYSLTYTYSRAFVKENTIVCKNQSGETVEYKVVIKSDRTVDLVRQ